MPYPNEHAARLVDPKGFDRVRRQNDKFGSGIHAIFGVKDNKSTLQAIRFDAEKFTAAQARAWLKEHDYGYAKFEAASKKRKPIAFECEISKVDDELRIAWGFAYVVEKNGKRVVDHSEELALNEREVQKCAHRFVLNSRLGGVMHKAEAGEIVDSIFFSREVQKALGIDVPVGWFIGMQINDDDAWQGVKDGTYKGFSIQGTALKREVTDAEAADLSL